MIQPNELIVTIGRLPDNSAFTVDATGRDFIIVDSVQGLLDEVKNAVIQHTTILSTDTQNLIKMKNFTPHSLTDWIKDV